MAHGIDFRLDGAVATLTLDRPQVGNAMDLPMAREFMQLAIRCEGDAAVRCVVITGAGRLFCAGGDIAAFADAGDRLPDFIREITAYLHSAVAALARMDKPLVVAVNGAAAGAGVGLAMLGDIVLCDPAASFSLAYTAIGLAPDGGTSWLLPRLIGLRRAQELCLTNRKVKAGEAVALGLATRVTAEGELAAETQTLAQQLARGATGALGAVRKLLVESFSSSLEDQLAHESLAITAQARGAEGREGVAAFLAKRAPKFMKED